MLRTLAALVLLVAGAAHAAPSRGESPEYQRAIRSALAEFDAGNFPEARALFSTAHELYPNARTYRGLGFVEFELRNYVDAIAHLEAALSSDKKPLEGDVRRSTEELLLRAREMIAKVTLRILPRAESLRVDGVDVLLSDDEALTMPVGDHVVEVRTTGYLTERRPLKVARGGALSVTIELKRVEAKPENGPRVAETGAPASADSSHPSDTPPPRRAWYKSPWLWTSVAVVAVGAGVGTYFLLRRDDSPSSAPPPTTANTPPGGVIEALRF